MSNSSGLPNYGDPWLFGDYSSASQRVELGDDGVWTVFVEYTTA